MNTSYPKREIEKVKKPTARERRQRLSVFAITQAKTLSVMADVMEKDILGLAPAVSRLRTAAEVLQLCGEELER